MTNLVSCHGDCAHGCSKISDECKESHLSHPNNADLEKRIPYKTRYSYRTELSYNATFDIIVTNTGAATPSIVRSSLGDGTEIANALYPFFFKASIII